MDHFSPAQRRWLTKLTATASTLALATAGPVATSVAAPAPVTATVQSIAPSTFTLTRSQVDTAVVTVRLVVPAGQKDTYRADGVDLPAPALVDQSKGVRALPRTALSLQSGTATDGIWVAEIPVGAVNRGRHTFSVEACPTTRACDTRGPVTVDLGEGITVHGTDWPVFAGLAQQPERLPDGQSRGASVVGRVVYSATGDPAAAIDIALIRSPGTLPDLVATTGSRGRFSAPWPWPKRHVAQLVALTGAGSSSVVVDRHRLGLPATTFVVRTGSSKAIVHPGDRWTLSGTVTPGVSAVPLGPVLLQRREGHRWHTIGHTRLVPVVKHGRTTMAGSYTFSRRFQKNGQLTLRVRKPAVHAVRSGTSDPVVLVVGSATYLVERRLDALHVPVGEVDGVIDARGAQALCAWRDMTGRKPSREGLNPKLARSVLSAHRLPKPDRTDGLYVDKTCQMLFQVVDHKYRRVVWVSTGMSGFDTPVGTGAIYRKRPGFVESTLYPGAYMYYPMNFFPDRPAIALHGSVSNDYVAPYPASHGCIRVWRPQILRIYRESPLGTKVQVYGKY